MKKTSTAALAILLGCVLPQTAPAAGAPKFKEKVLYSFCIQQQCTDGKSPQYSGVVDVKGTLYGTTQNGGDTDSGTVFAIDPKTGGERVVHSFSGPDGRNPLADLIVVKGILYGTTIEGGDVGCFGFGCGTVFSVDPNTGVETVLHSFGGTNDGSGPEAGGLIEVKGILYGTTLDGGEHGQGTVFSLDLSTGVEKVLHSFPDGADDGYFPMAGLIAMHGKLYGTANFGGSFGGGVIFSVDPKTGAEKAVYSFCAQFGCPDGEYPEASLIAVSGILYGTTSVGGAGCTDTRPTGCGAVFAFDPKSGVETMVHAFAGGADGQYPLAGVAAVNDTLYGTTSAGGYDYGTVFSVDLSTGMETVLHTFGGGAKQDARQPEAGLTVVKGSLYGTALSGGTENFGAVFVLRKKN